MKYQKDTYSCGAAAVVNALRCYGKKVSEMKVRSFSGTSRDGTNEKGIIQALKDLGYDGSGFEVIESEEALGTLAMSLVGGNPVIICTQNLQHWVTVIGVLGLGSRYIIADPARTVRNTSENGVHIVSKRELKKMWQCRNGRFFGIVCRRKK